MNLFRDFYRHNLTIRKRYWAREILNPYNWGRIIKWRRQRINRGWSDRDTWGGGEHIASVALGVIKYLYEVQHMVDYESKEAWDFNFENQYGYNNLGEVARDLDNYLWWEENSFSSPLWEEYKDHNETRWAIEYQLYQDYKNAMHFVADNIGGLWW